MLNFQGTVYIRTGLLTHCPFVGGSIFLVNPGSVLSINQHYDPDNSMIVGKPKPDPRPRGPFASCGDCPYISQGFICFSREGDCMRTYMQSIRKKNKEDD